MRTPDYPVRVRGFEDEDLTVSLDCYGAAKAGVGTDAEIAQHTANTRYGIDPEKARRSLR